MELLDAVRCEQEQAKPSLIPADAQLVISVLSGEESTAANRRRFTRSAYQVPALLSLRDDASPGPAHVRIYTRDANQRGVGFVTQESLAVGYDAWIYIAGPDREGMRLAGCILRCREVMGGWYEGAVLFYAPEMRLAAEALLTRGE